MKRLCLLGIILLGCGDSSKRTSDSSATTDAAGDTIDAGGPDAPATTDDAGAADSSAARADAQPPSSVCGGFSGLQCDAHEVCDWPDDSCGSFDSTGICTRRPRGCLDIWDPVCACNGQVYTNHCFALLAGFDGAAAGGCTPPSGMFACGGGFCSTGESYCMRWIGGPAGEVYYACLALPAGCGADPACDCLHAVDCGDFCVANEGGDLTVDCTGG